jgi:hypothetical protein
MKYAAVSLDHLVGAGNQRRGQLDADWLRRLQVDIRTPSAAGFRVRDLPAVCHPAEIAGSRRPSMPARFARQEYFRPLCRGFKMILSCILRRATAVLSIKPDLKYIAAHLADINDVDSDLILF